MSRDTTRYFFGAHARRPPPQDLADRAAPVEPVPAYLKQAVLARIAGVTQEPPLARGEAGKSSV